MKAVALLSGGIDSTTALAWALDLGWDVTALSFDYGQRHGIELEAARKIARHYDVVHVVLDLPGLGGSALTFDEDVPLDRKIDGEIPVTYVPGRNLVFLAHAVSLAEQVGAQAVLIGANALDYSGYPDCRPDFLLAFAAVANLGTKFAGSLRIEAPLVNLTKAEVIRLGLSLDAPLALTVSCYLGTHCGRCDSCQIRDKGWVGATAE